jgi:transcriptional regulator with XRE-family HTH domain
MARYRIREILDARGMSANELARRSGVSGLTLTNLLQGRTEAMAFTLEKLATALGVTPEELLAEAPTP